MAPLVWLTSMSGTQIYLTNRAGQPTLDGDVGSDLTTALALKSAYTPKVAEDGQEMVKETLTLWYRGSTIGTALDSLARLRRVFSEEFDGPAALAIQPSAELSPVYFRLESVTPPQEVVLLDSSPAEGTATFEIEIAIERSAFGGPAVLSTIVSNTSVTNGTAIGLGDLLGDLAAAEGQPLNLQIAKPAGSAAALLHLATIQSRIQVLPGSSQSSTSTTTGTAFAATSAISLAALRRRTGVKTRIVARLSSISNPTLCEARAQVQSNAGGVLWTGSWVALGSATTQLLDLGYASLDTLRTPATPATSIKVVVSLRSTSGAIVSATLAALDVLLYYDYCQIASAGLGSGQSYALYGADDLAGAGWNERCAPLIEIVDSTGAVAAAAGRSGQFVRARTDASLWLAWVDGTGAYVAADTTTATVKYCPLWRTLRGSL